MNHITRSSYINNILFGTTRKSGYEITLFRVGSLTVMRLKHRTRGSNRNNFVGMVIEMALMKHVFHKASTLYEYIILNSAGVVGLGCLKLRKIDNVALVLSNRSVTANLYKNINKWCSHASLFVGICGACDGEPIDMIYVKNPVIEKLCVYRVGNHSSGDL